MRLATGHSSAAAEVLEEALGISRDIGYRLGQVNVLNNLGEVRTMTGDYLAAAEVLRQ